MGTGAVINPTLKISYASGGGGTMLHMRGELFRLMAAVDTSRRRARRAARPDRRSGAAHVRRRLSSVPHVRVRELRALAVAVTTATARKDLPDVPPISDGLPGFEATSWQGVWAPRNTGCGGHRRDSIARSPRRLTARRGSPRSAPNSWSARRANSASFARAMSELVEGDPGCRHEARVMTV